MFKITSNFIISNKIILTSNLFGRHELKFIFLIENGHLLSASVPLCSCSTMLDLSFLSLSQHAQSCDMILIFWLIRMQLVISIARCVVVFLY